MYRYCAWQFPDVKTAAAEHEKLIAKSRGLPVSVSRLLDDLVVVICDNREAYRKIKRHNPKAGQRVIIPAELYEFLIERRQKMAPKTPGEMLRILTGKDGTQIQWHS